MGNMFEPVGTTVSFDSGFLAKIIDMTGPEISRDNFDVNHFGLTDWQEFQPVELTDPGELSLSIGFAPGTAPPINDAAETITIAYNDSAATSWSASGFMTGFSPTGSIGDKMTADVTIKLTGAINFDV